MLIDDTYLSFAFLFTVTISAFSLECSIQLHFMFLLIGLILCQFVPSRFLLLLLLLSICSSYINFFLVNLFLVHPLHLLILNWYPFFPLYWIFSWLLYIRIEHTFFFQRVREKIFLLFGELHLSPIVHFFHLFVGLFSDNI